MSIEFPDLDPRDEEQVTVDVIDALPPELSDRNKWTPEVKIIEAVGAFYAIILFYLNSWSERLQLAVLKLLDLQPKDAISSTVTISLTRTSAVGELTIPAATIIKDAVGVDANKFTTDFPVTLVNGIFTIDVTATAVEAGAAANVAPGTLTRLDQPITGLTSVTNIAASSGGIDQETVAALIVRAPLAIRSQERAITAEDFIYHSLNVDGVLRAVSSGNAGNVSVFIIDSNLNETISADLIDATQTELLSRTTPGVGVSVSQGQLRLVAMPDIELKLKPGYSVLDIIISATAALAANITALDIFDEDGYTIKNPAWPFGDILYVNEVISLLDGLEGVKRVGVIQYEASDDYGTTWSPAAVLSTVNPGRDGIDDFNFGLLHFDASRPLNITEIT